MTSKTRRTILQAIATSTAGVVAGPLQAQENWPTRPIRIIVPVAAGGIIDLLSRNLAEALRGPGRIRSVAGALERAGITKS